MSTQTTCKNCNATLDEGTVFCPMCGTKRDVASPPEKNVFCSKCGKPSGAELAFCQECGNPLRENAEAVTSNNNNEPKKDIKGMLKKPIFLVIPAAVIVLILLIALVIKPKGSSHLIYVKDKELQYSHLSKKKGFELTGHLIEGAGSFDADDYLELSVYIFMSDDGRYIFYPDRISGYETTYYWRDLKADNSKNDTSVKIDSEISYYPFLSSDGSKFFYVKGNDNRLYVYDRKANEKVKIDDDVNGFYVNDSGDYIIYHKYVDNEYAIYEMSMKGTSGEKTKIDSNSIIEAAYPNDKKIYYSKEDSLYLKESGKEKEKISSGIVNLLSIVDNNSVYYLKGEEVVNKLSNYIKDDMMEEDKEPIYLPELNYSDEPLYPSESDYQIATWVDTFWGYERHPETNEWGYWDYTTDQEAYNAAINEYLIKYANWEKEVEKYNNEYNEAYQKLLAKDLRDSIREVIDDDEYAIKHQQFSLYYWNKGKETLVASDVDPYSFSTSTNVSAVVYQKHNTAPIETKKLSEITSGDDDYDSGYYYIYELQDKIRESRSLSDDKFVAIEEKEATLECNNARNLKINKEGAIYFLNDYNDEKYYGDLMSAVIKNGAVEKPVKIDDDVMGYQFGNENNIILYYKDVKNEAGDVYMNNKFMASDVYIPSLYNFKGKNKLLYYIDYSDKSQSGTLCLYDNDSVVKISDDVSFFVPINDKDIAYLIDYRFDREKGDLMLYNGKKKPTPIDSDVTALLWNPKMFWHNNWYYYY